MKLIYQVKIQCSGCTKRTEAEVHEDTVSGEFLVYESEGGWYTVGKGCSRDDQMYCRECGEYLKDI